MKQIILLSGPVASGKSTLARALASHFDIATIETRELIYGALTQGVEPNRRNLQMAGDWLDRRTDGGWIRDEVNRRTDDICQDENILVDSVRRLSQVEAIREAYGAMVTHIHLTAPLEVLAARYTNRSSSVSDQDSFMYEDMRGSQTERMVDGLQASADLVIDSDSHGEEAVISRVASYLKLKSKPVLRDPSEGQ